MKTVDRKYFTFALIFLGALAAGPVGCSRSSKRTETTTVSDTASGPVETSKTVSEESSSSSSGCSGVLSCTVDTLGTIIAFPFKVVGSLFEAIF